jgi:hypothetical protein
MCLVLLGNCAPLYPSVLGAHAVRAVLQFDFSFFDPRRKRINDNYFMLSQGEKKEKEEEKGRKKREEREGKKREREERREEREEKERERRKERIFR